MKMITAFLLAVILILTTLPLVNNNTTGLSTLSLNDQTDLTFNENDIDGQIKGNDPNSVLDPINYHLATNSDILLMKQQLFEGDNSTNKTGGDLGAIYATGLLAPNADYLESLLGKFLIYDPVLVTSPLNSPSSFDLSIEPYFPQVRSQGHEGACAGFAVIYYNYGYLEALDNGWTDASTGNDAHLMSPAWTYNKVKVDESGSYKEENALIAKDIGVSSWAEMPFVDGDSTNWGREGAWRDAPLHRIDDFVIIPYDASTMVQTVKDMLASNHPVSISMDSSFINGNPGSAFTDGNFILSSAEYDSTTTSHAVTIIGYDDTVTDDGDIGAFKIVNSWGDDWGDSGYFWMTYGAFKEIGNHLGALTLLDKADYQPKMVAAWEFTPSPSRDSVVQVGAYSFVSGIYNTIEPFWRGVDNYVLPNFMCLDITELDTEFQNGVRSFALSIDDSTIPGSVVEFRIERYDAGYNPGGPSEISAPLRGGVDVPGIVISNWRSSTLVINEDFDGILEQSWYIRDLNSDAGTDTWGLSDYRSLSGGYSAWCAQSGSNSHNGELNSVNNYYDESMDADVYVVLDLNVTAYDEMSMEFAYWAVTGSLSFNDNFLLREYYSSAWHTVWTQPQMNSGGWKEVTVQLNNRSTAFEFSFHSDDTVGLGPYEGVYIDDVSLWATEYRRPISLLTAPAMTNASTFDVQVAASDVGSGISGVYIFYAPDGSTDYIPYQDASHPDGIFATGTIQLATSVLGGDGIYGLKSCAVDQAGNFELYKEWDDAVVIVDTIAPSSKVLLTGSMGGNGWFVSPVTVNLSGEDLGSGVKEIRYRLNMEEWISSSSPITLTMDQNGVNALEFYSVDNTNNRGQTEIVTVNIDTTMPITAVVFSYSFNDSGWNNEPVTASLAAVDNVSGISAMWYRIGAGDFTEYSGTIFFNDTGEYDLEYYAVDNAGNEGLHQHRVIMVDVTAPMAELNLSSGDRTWSNDTFTVVLVCSDDGSGIASAEYRLNGGDWLVYSNPFTISEEGFYLLEFQVSDLVGNSILINRSRGLDRTAPTTALDVDGLIVDGLVYANQLTLILQANDDGSGVDLLAYSLDYNEWQNYSEGLVVASPGSHVLRYRSIDNAENREIVQFFNFTVIIVTSPGMVSNAQATYVDGAIIITWLPPDDDGGSVITSYDIYRSTNDGDFIKIATVYSTTYNDLNIATGGSYGYYIIAHNCYSSSDPCSAISMKVPEAGIDHVLIALIAIVIIGTVIGLVVWRMKRK